MNELENIREFYRNVELFEFAFQVNTNINILDIRLGNIIRIVNNMIYLFDNGMDIHKEYMQCAKSIKTTEYVIGHQNILQNEDVVFVQTILDELKILLHRFILCSKPDNDADKIVLLHRMREVRDRIILLVNRFKDKYSRNSCNTNIIQGSIQHSEEMQNSLNPR